MHIYTVCVLHRSTSLEYCHLKSAQYNINYISKTDLKLAKQNSPTGGGYNCSYNS
jgi:hypothetical protein